jgi:hypothetical protein
MGSSSPFSAVGTRMLLTLLTFAAFLGAGEASGASLTASWVDNSHGVATTRVERRLGTTAFAAIAEVPPGTTQYVDASVSPRTEYCYGALAYTADAVSPYSDEVCAVSGNQGYELDLTVRKDGDGTGTVTSTPGGIFCGTDCSETYLAGTPVTLIAVPAVGSTFTGWSGPGCDGFEPCTLTGQGPVTVTATFTTPFSVSPFPGPERPGPPRPPFYVPPFRRPVVDAGTSGGGR